MASVRILATPPGEAPEDIRRAWIGVVIPLPATHPLRPMRVLVSGVLTKSSTAGHAQPWTGFCLDGAQSVQALQRTSPSAAAWWRENASTFTQTGNSLVFPEDCCELLVSDEERAAFTESTMFAFFTERAKQVMANARSECLHQSDVMIEPKHLLAGILNCEGCVANAALKRVGVDADALWAAVAPEPATEGRSSPDAVPFDPMTKRVLQCSFDEAKNLGYRHIGTEHLLLGLARIEQCELARALTRPGASLERLRLAVREALGEAM